MTVLAGESFFGWLEPANEWTIWCRFILVASNDGEQGIDTEVLD